MVDYSCFTHITALEIQTKKTPSVLNVIFLGDKRA